MNHLTVRLISTALLLTTLLVGTLKSHADETLQISPACGLPNYTKTSLAAYGVKGKGFYPTFALGDFNEDGRMDALVLVGPPFGQFPLGVIVYLQNIDGTLTKKAEYELPTANATLDFLAADFNEDGHLDLVANDMGNDLIILFGNGDGTFRDPQFMGLNAPGFPVALDINNDHHMDLIAGNLDGFIGVFLGKGDGTFQVGPMLDSVVRAALPGRFGQILVGDLNNDGKTDLAVASPANSNTQVGTLDVFLGNGDGTFRDPIRNENVAARRGALADFNGDGILDYAGDRDSPEQVDIWIGKGDGHFTKSRSPDFEGVYPQFIKAADLNSDGIPDLLVAAEGNDFPAEPLSIFLGKGDGTFQARRSFTPFPGALVYNFGPQIRDFDGDGRPDIICIGGSPTIDNAFTVALNKGVTADPKVGYLLNVDNVSTTPGPLLLETTTNFIDWTALATNSSPHGKWPVIDTATGRNQRFYRTRRAQ